MIKCNILLFGIAADIVGATELTIDIAENTDVSSLKATLIDTYGGLNNIHQFAIAVNESYAKNETLIQANDIVAIIPPVSGG